MEIKQLESFAAVVRLGSFTRAAEELYISQPTVSTHIRALEEELGGTLLLRSRTGVTLTREGELNGWELRMTISAVSKITGNQIFISDPTGVIISCSDMNIACDHLGRQIDPAVFIQLRSSETFNQMTNLYGFYDTPHYVVAQAIQTVDGAGVMGYVFITSDSASIVESWYTFVWVFIAASIAVMLLALLLSLMTAKRMAQPLDEMARASRKFAHGDFSVRVKEDGRTD